MSAETQNRPVCFTIAHGFHFTIAHSKAFAPSHTNSITPPSQIQRVMTAPSNNAAAIWVLCRLLAGNTQPKATILKTLQAVPIANAALSVKDSGATLDAKARNALVIGKLDYMAGQFHDWLRGTYLGLTPGATVPAWITKEKLTHSTLKETLFTDGAAWDKWLSLCKVITNCILPEYNR